MTSELPPDVELAMQEVYAAVEDDLDDYYAQCNDNSSDDGSEPAAGPSGGQRSVGKKSPARPGMLSEMPARLSLKQEAASPRQRDEVEEGSIVGMIQRLHCGAQGTAAGGGAPDSTALLCCEMLSIVRQLPCTYFQLHRAASGSTTWEVTKQIVHGLLEPSTTFGSGIMLVVNGAIDLANDARHLQHEVATAAKERQGSASSGIVAIAHLRSANALLDVLRRVVEVLEMRALTLQRDMLLADPAKRTKMAPARLFLILQEWMVAPRRCLSLFLSGLFTTRGNLVDGLAERMEAAQDARDEAGFAFYAALHGAAVWPYVELCVRTVFNDVQLEARELRQQLPRCFADQRYGQRDVVSACISCEHVVAQVQSESVVRQACYDILQRLVTHSTAKAPQQRPRDTTAVLEEVCGDDTPPPRDHCLEVRVPYTGRGSSDDERLGVAACFHPLSFGTRIEDGTCPASERLPPLRMDFSVPCGRVVFAFYLQPLLQLADAVQAKEVHKLMQTYLSAEQKQQADLHEEPPLVFRDVLRLLEDAALMGNWLTMQSGFVGPLAQDRTAWWTRKTRTVRGTASPVLSALFLDTVRQVQNGAWISMAVLPPRDASEESSGRESVGRRMVRTLAAMRLDVEIPRRLESIFPVDETREAYSAAFCHVATLALAQRTLEMRWKVLHEQLKSSPGTAAMRDAGQCNAVLLFAFGAILRFVRHEFHVAITEFRERLGGNVASVEELRRRHLEMVTALLQTSFATRGTQPLRVATESLVCLVLDATLEAGYVVSRVKVAIAALLAAIQALPQDSPLSAKTRPLLQALTFNGFFADPSSLS